MPKLGKLKYNEEARTECEGQAFEWFGGERADSGCGQSNACDGVAWRREGGARGLGLGDFEACTVVEQYDDVHMMSSRKLVPHALEIVGQLRNDQIRLCSLHRCVVLLLSATSLVKTLDAPLRRESLGSWESRTLLVPALSSSPWWHGGP